MASSILKAFRLPENIVQTLNILAKENNRSEKFYVVEALKRYFEEYEDCQIAKERFSDPHSRVISSKELRKKLGV